MKRKQRFISALLAWSGLAFPFLSLAVRRAHSCHFGLGPRMRRYTEWSWTRATAYNRRTVAHLQTSKQEISVVTSRILGYLLYSMLSHFSRVWLFVTPWTIALQVCLTIGFSGKNIGVDCYTLLQGIFLTQELNPHFLLLLHWQAGSLPLALPGKTSEAPGSYLGSPGKVYSII